MFWGEVVLAGFEVSGVPLGYMSCCWSCCSCLFGGSIPDNAVAAETMLLESVSMRSPGMLVVVLMVGWGASMEPACVCSLSRLVVVTELEVVVVVVTTGNGKLSVFACWLCRRLWHTRYREHVNDLGHWLHWNGRAPVWKWWWFVRSYRGRVDIGGCK